MSRRPTVWYRVDRRQWFTTMQGRQVPLGVFGPNEQAAALDALRRLLEVSQSQALPATPVGKLVEQFLAEKAATVRPNTVHVYRAYLATFVALNGTVSSAKPEILTAIAAAHPSWSDNNRRNYLAAVELFRRWAGHPIDLDKPARESAGARMVISEETHHMACGAARGDLRPLLRFLWPTGCRPSEATGLTVEGVDWKAGMVTLKEHKMKRKGRQRLLYLEASGMAVLEGQREKHGTGLLFRNQLGSRFTLTGLTQALWRISERIGRHVTAYGYRHSFATRALEKGIPETHVAALLGHGSTRMLNMHYSHLSQNAALLKEAAARVAG